ncbi:MULTISPECIES: HrpE family protein [Xanthomonas]|jgi:type III secretion hrp pilus HrpE|uniref:HrpE protein n=1 Tax=Xanthomonas euroxanthea TaxID=2259622 RepID=A0AA46H908_9XANT|nr:MULTISPECIES: HrpE family protein [Xanthomonas]PPT31186.1 serine kinase [Xanthomonas arboricola]MCC4615506.1 serine kinase [Xanthomonas campestris pv. asclepiadis]CAE1133156.1 serine kinase [Xanthomonas euroxanthea]CAG2083798.1 serine kinase [Xanthomonas euroxanthea]SUZ26713.1 HrpE protein [Xanthomonas euroxanthea]
MSDLQSIGPRLGQGGDLFKSDFSSRYDNHMSSQTSDNQMDSLMGGIGHSASAQERMNNYLTEKKNELDFNVALNKFIGKAGDNAKQLVGQ